MWGTLGTAWQSFAVVGGLNVRVPPGDRVVELHCILKPECAVSLGTVWAMLHCGWRPECAVPPGDSMADLHWILKPGCGGPLGTLWQSFAVFGGVYATASCMVQRLRMKQDAINGGIAGAITGLVLGWGGAHPDLGL
jgi:Tim17/Tim22/Tim23/Pmp24 family